MTKIVPDHENGMFSAASFAGVLNEFKKGGAHDVAELPSPPVIAFYGYRGGAGRTTALAHVAAMLAARQVAVVAVDLDLEAPGLHQVLDCPVPEEDRGGLVLLRAAAMAEADELEEALRLAPHIVKSGLDLGTPIRVLPAGRLSVRYLERLEDLGVPLWHIAEEPSPLEALVRRIKEELTPDVVLLDCRTGLSGLAASAVFHLADIVICFVPVSNQSLEGLGVFLKGIQAAKLHRSGSPEVLIVPSMVPDGPEGRSRLELFIPEIESRYAELVLDEKLSDDNAEDLAERIPIVREGIEYRRGIALADYLRSDFIQRSFGAYEALMRDLDGFLQTGSSERSPKIDAKKVLEELGQNADLTNLAFAESTDINVVVKKFIQPSDYRALVDRTTWYVVGAKGAGKTWLWQYLLSDVGQQASTDLSFIAAHGPKDALLTAATLREIDKIARLEKRQLYGAFWLLYAANRILQFRPNLAKPIGARHPAKERQLIDSLAGAAAPGEIQDALVQILRTERAGTFSEELIRNLDAALLADGERPITLLYDGLDTGFGSDEKSIAARSRFVDGLVEAIEPLRGSSKRIAFKLFLREDIYSAISIQNQSHLSAAMVELTWEPSDLWALALNLVAESPAYLECIRGIDPTAGPGQWPREEEQRRALLAPLWGDQMEKGNKVSTARFLQRRTSDGKKRLFPRTLVQLLIAAIEHQLSLPPSGDRVLRSAAIVHGYSKASQMRVDDLRKEYEKLGVYLDALRGMNPTGTEKEIENHLKKGLRNAPQSVDRARKGVQAGLEHAGPGGWHNVIERLSEVGVLAEYKRAKGKGGENKFEIALLYRPGLGIKLVGV